MSTITPTYASYKIWVKILGVWTDFTSSNYVIRDITGKWGMPGNEPLDLVAETGWMKLVLNNESGQFLPEMSTAMVGWKKGVEVKLEFTFDEQPFVRFKGVVSSIKPGKGLYGYLRVEVTILDWMQYAAEHPIQNPGVLTNQRGDDVIRTTVGLMPIQPAAMELDQGVSNFPTTFDTLKRQTKAYSEFAKVAFSEPGSVYLRKDKVYGETLVFESADHRSGSKPLSQIPKTKANSDLLLGEDSEQLLGEDGEELLSDDVTDFFANNTMMEVDDEYGEGVINHFTVYVPPRRLDTSPQILFKLDEPIVIGSGETIEIKGDYVDPAGGSPVNGQGMIDPEESTDYLAWTNADGTGTEFTADLAVTQGYGSEGFTHQVTNNSVESGWITKFNCRGYGIYQYNTIEHLEKNDTSINEMSTLPESMTMEYQADLMQGSLFAMKVVDDEAMPRRIVNKFKFNANSSPDLMFAWLYGDCGFLFKATSQSKEIIDTLYYVQAVEFTIRPGGAIYFTWTVVEPSSLESVLTPIAIEFAGGTATDGVYYGYLPKISNLPRRTYTAWVYLDAVPTGEDMIMSNWTGTIFAVDSNRQLRYLKGTAGYMLNPNWSWISNDLLTTGQWYLVVVSHDVSSNPNADPIFYINAVNAGLSFSSYPSAPIPADETGTLFVVGNRKNSGSDYSTCLDGKIKDPRVYDRILSADEITEFYNGGVMDTSLVRDGLVFSGFYARTKRLDQYVDETLTETQKILNNVYGAIGVPHGSPVGRAV